MEGVFIYLRVSHVKKCAADDESFMNSKVFWAPFETGELLDFLVK
jgi:hypothetical protein